MRIAPILSIVLSASLGACSATICSANSTCLNGALQSSTVQIPIDHEFSLYERARIFRAVNAETHAMAISQRMAFDGLDRRHSDSVNVAERTIESP